MLITPEKKREIDSEIAKFLQHLTTENREQLDSVDVIDLKNFDLAGRHFLSISRPQPDTRRYAAR